MTSLSHHVGTSYSHLCENECLHIAASKYIIEELDALHMIFPTSDFAGKMYNCSIVLLTSCYQNTDHTYHSPGSKVCVYVLRTLAVT